MIDSSDFGAPVVAGPCPPWCQGPPGHPFTDRDPATGTVVRTHSRTVGEHVEIVADDYAVTEDGPLWGTGEPRILVGPDLFAVSVEAADQLARDIEAAAATIGVRS